MVRIIGVHGGSSGHSAFSCWMTFMFVWTTLSRCLTCWKMHGTYVYTTTWKKKQNERTNKQVNEQKKKKKVDKKTQITCQNDCPECQVGIDSLTYILWNAHGWDRDEKFNWLSFIARWQIRNIFSLLPLISIGSDNQRISLLTEALTILHHSVNRRSENCASPGQQKHQNLFISLSTGAWKTASPSSQEH